jgi:formate dehydrogenase major subunit
MAECHPVGFRWVMEAKRRGATVIHIDPRFTRTSAVADLHVPIRAGSDIVFLGALVHYIIENERWFKDYVVNYTIASVLVQDTFRDTDELDGLFSGWDFTKHTYAHPSWQYQGTRDAVPAGGHKEVYAEPGAGGGGTPYDEQPTEAPRDLTLQDPRCIFQVLRCHFARYTPEMVEEACGIPRAAFEKVATTLCDNSNRERTSAFCYAVGWTQHSVGVQYIRTASIIQLLLGNIGRPGGGIMALRGHASIQGSTDIPTLFDLLPGYLPMPHARSGKTLKSYIQSHQSGTGWWSEFPKYVVSLLKVYFGDAARAENQFLFDALPRLTGNHSHMTTVAQMADGKIRGYLVMGENPAVGSMNGRLQRKGLQKLQWLVVRDLVLTETAEFWRSAPEVQRGEITPEEIPTEVFFFPAAAHTEKSGSFTNTSRTLQWHHAAVDPPGAARSELHFVFHLGKRLRELYRDSREARDAGLKALTWDYPTTGKFAEPDAEAVLFEINGYDLDTRTPLSGYRQLKDDGSTASGCWIYSGCYAEGINQTARRTPHHQQSWVAPDWGWAWPANRRLMYNRASADPQGRPWSERKKLVWWDATQQRWRGHDVPDFLEHLDPGYRPPLGAKGVASISGIDPFIMQADGKGWLFAPSGILDGPLPAHYEPQESPVPNPLYGQQCNPLRHEWRRRDNRYHRAFADPDYPFVITTFRLTEHHTAGGMSRWLSWLSELQPELFCEVSPELATVRQLEHGGWATLTTARGSIACRVLVTERVRPLKMGKRVIHQIMLPYHWSFIGRVKGDTVNDLAHFVGDPNVNIQESKAMTANIQAGRSADQGQARVDPLRLEEHRDLQGVGQRESEPVQEGRDRLASEPDRLLPPHPGE